MKNFKFLIFAFIAIVLTAIANPAAGPPINHQSVNFDAPTEFTAQFADKSVSAVDDLFDASPVAAVRSINFATQKEISFYIPANFNYETASYSKLTIKTVLLNNLRQPPEEVKLE